MTYYAIRWSIKDGAVSHNERTGDKATMERQYFLYCASAATNEAGNSFDSVELGTVEGGRLKREVFDHAE